MTEKEVKAQLSLSLEPPASAWSQIVATLQPVNDTVLNLGKKPVRRSVATLGGESWAVCLLIVSGKQAVCPDMGLFLRV